ncbi:lipoprotein [Caballeronia turbans]|jgi:hypothetical protein|uniref:DUF799 domain-containing protein n=1 Tax=unclassified Caballeronia TaxID=2646786 RepID=UPI00074C8DC4|nr:MULTISPECIES: DUF799 domain-containing protein [unclassified Caballeronia]SAL13258.1 lipoprotein [Caballeronia turbans]
MTFLISRKLVAVVSVLLMLSACASHSPSQTDHAAFRSNKPRSVLVLPPLNDTNDVNATYGMLSQMTMPLAEGGYYVVPVAEMEETFRRNGLTTANDIQNVAPEKLRSIFGADAALYTKITDYGSSYRVIANRTVVAAQAKLVDLRSGDLLWSGSATANGSEVGGDFSVGSGLVGALVQNAVKHVVNVTTDKAWSVAGLTSQRLLATGGTNGMLYGPRSPKYDSN